MFDKPDIANLVNQITSDVRGIIADEIALAKAELKPDLKRLAVGGGLGAVAVACLLIATVLGWFLVATGFAWLYASVTTWSPWASAFLGLATGLVLALVLAVIVSLVAIGRFKRLQAPQRTPAAAQQTITAVKDGIAHGQALVKQETRRV
jgi:hypothetical protein